MIEDDLRRELVDALERVPGIMANDSIARTVLLAGVPNAAYLSRNPSNAHGDITVLVLQLEETYSAEGDWRLLQLIDNALPLVVGTSLGDKLLQLRLRLQKRKMPLFSRPNPAEYAQPYRFDLRKIVKVCLALVEGPPRLSGFVVQTQSHRFLDNLCQGLKHRGHEDSTWDRAKVRILPIKEVDPRHTSVTQVISNATCYEKLLTEKVVILRLRVTDASDAQALWDGLAAAFPRQLNNHLVVLMAVPQGCAPPAGTSALPPPTFEQQHVTEWVREIVVTLKWSDSLVADWVQQIVTLAFGEVGDLSVEMVYEQLDYFRNLLSDYNTEEAFRSVLQEMKDLGEFYAPTH